jgi:uncharacterized protein YcbX
MLVSRIWVHPIKSLDAVEVTSARVTAGGSLENDRLYALTDLEGKIVNGKRTPRIHALHCEYSGDFTEVEFHVEGGAEREAFSLADPIPCETWLSRFFGFRVRLAVNRHHGFPDDLKASGPTVVSEASLAEVNRWFPELSPDSVRRRFRSNVELRDCEPFGEDRLFGAAGESREFRVGEVRFLGHNPCQRCVVPTRDPDSGQPTSGFQKRFAEKRAETLPAGVEASRFNHYYRLAVNTTIPPLEAGKWIRKGDMVEPG